MLVMGLGGSDREYVVDFTKRFNASPALQNQQLLKVPPDLVFHGQLVQSHEIHVVVPVTNCRHKLIKRSRYCIALLILPQARMGLDIERTLLMMTFVNFIIKLGMKSDFNMRG
jgi:hypothetical protein